MVYEVGMAGDVLTVHSVCAVSLCAVSVCLQILNCFNISGMDADPSIHVYLQKAKYMSLTA